MRQRHITEGGTKALRVTAEVDDVVDTGTPEATSGDTTGIKMAVQSSKNHNK